MMNLLLRYIIICLVGIVSANNYVFAQFPTTCNAPRAIDATIFNTYNHSNVVNSSAEYWYEFEIDPLTADRFISISLSNGTRPTRLNYEIYGPFTSYNCNSLSTPFAQGENYSYSLVSQTSQCATYQDTYATPSLTFQMTSSPTSTNYYLVRIILLPGEVTTQQITNVSSVPQSFSYNTTTTDYCSNYNDTIDVGCGPNKECHSPITICSDFVQSHSCSCDFLGINRFYVLDIQHVNTTVNVTIPTPFSSMTSVKYSLSNQMLYGPCEPSLMSPTNLLHSGSSQSFSYTFPNTGLYMLNVATHNLECPTIEIDFVDIDENCQPIITPPIIDFQAVCTGNNTSNIINLIYNGDFEVGDFSENITQISSDDIYQAGGIPPAEGHYSIIQSPFQFLTQTYYNHTPNVGNNGFFMFAHDDLLASNDEYIWKKVVTNILPNTQYVFEAWFMLYVNTDPSRVDNLNLYINNQLVASKNRALSTPGVWEKVEYVWNSGSNTTADLRIEIENNNEVDDGRIFLDDISFKMVEPEMECCANQEIVFDIIATGDISNATFSWDFGDGSPTSSTNSHTYTSPGTYTITLNVTFPDASVATITHAINIIDCDYICETCIGSFAPIPGQKYLVTAWAKEVGASLTKTTYDNPQLSLLFNDGNNTVLGPFIPTGDIIDGWQRIEVEFVVPSSAQEMEILFGSVSGEVLFDDIRVLPFNSNMKSFVYDPINMRLVAELDERHYATFYEYDEEGQLIRVKKETERGIMTIQETKSNTSKPE